MEKPTSTAVETGLPSQADRPDLYDGFDGLQPAPEWDNPVGAPSRLQALIVERQAKAKSRKQAREYVGQVSGKTLQDRTIEKATAPKRTEDDLENRRKVTVAS